MTRSTILAVGATIFALLAVVAPAGMASGHQGGGEGSLGRPAPSFGVAAPIPREAGDGFQPHRRGDMAVAPYVEAGSEVRSATLVSPVEVPQGFDWADAVIGAAVALAAVALLVVAGRGSRGHGRPARTRTAPF